MGKDDLEEYFRQLHDLLVNTEVTNRAGESMSLHEGTDAAIALILGARSTGSKIMLAGNGGSAAIVSHVQNDLCKAIGVRAVVFTEQPLLTALANDDGYASVYERPIELWADSGDLALMVSSSGRSENMRRAAAAAVRKGCQLVTLSGFDPANPLRQMGDLNFYVASSIYGFVETAHTGLLHFITDQTRERIQHTLVSEIKLGQAQHDGVA